MEFGNADGFFDAVGGVLRDEAVLFPAEEKADGGFVVGGLDLGVHGAQVEVELSDVFGLERAAFEFDHNVAFEAGVIEEQGDEKFVAADFDAKLTSDKGEAGTELQQEAGDVADEGVFDVAFVGVVGKAEEIEEVGVFEGFVRERGVRRWQAQGKVADGGALRAWSLFSMFLSSVRRDQPPDTAWAAYHSRSMGCALVSRVTMWNQGNWAAGCCPNWMSGQCSAKYRMYLRLLLEKPFMSGKADFRSSAMRSMILVPQPCVVWRSRISHPMW